MPSQLQEPLLPSTETRPADEPETSFADLLRENDLARAGAVDRTSGSKQIDATVVAVSADSVYLDIGYKTEGVLPLSAFAATEKAVEAGDIVRVTVKGGLEDGYYQLTRQRVATPKDYTSLEEAFAAKGTVLGTVTGVVKGGLTVDIGMRAFLPASRTGTRDAAELEKLVGQEIRVRITSLDLDESGAGKNDAVVDRRSVLEEEAKANADVRFSELAEGQIVDGTVRSLTDFGAFVDLNGADALLHISDMAWTRVANPADIVAVGDTVTARILKIDSTNPDKRRIAIGLKQLHPHPWDTVPERFHLGDRVTGTITRDADFGAFVEIAPGVEGLIHISEMAWGKKVRKPSDVVKVGDTVDAVILGIQLEEKRISLGLKQALGDPWAEIVKTVGVGSTVEGPVASITKFGAFIELAEGVQGMVHISEIVADKRLNHPSDALRVGELVRALVLEIDKDKRQLRLSIKQLIPTGLDEFIAEHTQGDTVTGRIISIDEASNSARVELGEGIYAPCQLPTVVAPVVATAPANASPASPVDLSQLGSLLASKWKTDISAKPAKTKPAPKPAMASDAPYAGQIRSFRIANLDIGTKKLSLTLAEESSD